MQQTDNNVLLRQYAENHSDEAFAELVARHVNLVYSVALRHVGDPHQAEEVAQAVFITLAKKAAQLRHEKALASWLFQATRLMASNFVRAETRRHRREQEAHMQSVLNESGSNDWPSIAPWLDDAVAGLSEKDRLVIVLRFYEGRNLREVGTALGASEDAAQKRISRAVERLREYFAKRGVTVGASGLVFAISANAVQAAPLGLAAMISTNATVAGTAFATTTTAAKTIAMTTVPKTLLAAALVAVVGTGLYEAYKSSTPRNRVSASLHRQMTNSIGMGLILIPKGTFQMGSSEVERTAVLAVISEREMPDWLKAEGPQHAVEISEPFYLGKYEVTQKQFREVMGYNPSFFSRSGTAKEGKSYLVEPAGGKEKVKEQKDGQLDDFPVENVSWEEAESFCERLSNLTEEKRAGRTYRLPTEAEWEYACRGGDSSSQTFHFGNSLSSMQANFRGNSPYGGAATGPSLERSCQVGSYKDNGFGLYDLHGNVLEWCDDWYDEGYYTNSPMRDPHGPSEGSGRVVRGGCWDNNGRSCRTARRNWMSPANRNNFVGFRVALATSEASKQSE